jgi:hypothetical protein
MLIDALRMAIILLAAALFLGMWAYANLASRHRRCAGALERARAERDALRLKIWALTADDSNVVMLRRRGRL